MDILDMLLSRGADPNLVVAGEGATLRPVLAEYLSSNTQLSANVLKLLLKYGAKVCTYIRRKING